MVGTYVRCFVGTLAFICGKLRAVREIETRQVLLSVFALHGHASYNWRTVYFIRALCLFTIAGFYSMIVSTWYVKEMSTKCFVRWLVLHRNYQGKKMESREKSFFDRFSRVSNSTATEIRERKCEQSGIWFKRGTLGQSGRTARKQLTRSNWFNQKKQTPRNYCPES